jgi:hypothetical protein
MRQASGRSRIGGRIMSRLMSVAFTEDAVRNRTKTVTRRKGWWEDKNGRRLLLPGDKLTLCPKVMGRKKGEPLDRIVEVEVLDVRREPLCAVAGPYKLNHEGRDIYWPELVAEGFPDLTPVQFMLRYFIDAQGIGAMDTVTRIEWRYPTCDHCGCNLPAGDLCKSCWDELHDHWDAESGR